MKGVEFVRRRLGWKLLLSYMVIILVGVVSLAITAQVHTPSALARHMANMRATMDGMPGGLMSDLLENFTTAVNEILLVAASLAAISAVIVSTFVTRRIVTPIQEMKSASQRIAAGRYDERVHITGEDELSELGLAFNQMAHTLAQSEERRRLLIGDVAHELRTPLSSLKSVMEGLVDGVLPANSATFLGAQRELNRLQRLVRDLEELSRAEAGQIKLDVAPADIGALVAQAADRLRPQYEDKGVQLHLEVPAGGREVKVDAARITQVLLNLLGNALQYTPAGGAVNVAVQPRPNQVAIVVQDTGIGLAPEHLAHIFERFYRVDKSRSRTGGGSGIGLTISKYLVEAHDGEIVAASPGPGLGSTFTITLPTGPDRLSQN